MKALTLLQSSADPGSGYITLPMQGVGKETEITRGRLAHALSCTVKLVTVPHLDPAAWVGLALPKARHALARAYLTGYDTGKGDGMNLHQGREVCPDDSCTSLHLGPI